MIKIFIISLIFIFSQKALGQFYSNQKGYRVEIRNDSVWIDNLTDFKYLKSRWTRSDKIIPLKKRKEKENTLGAYLEDNKIVLLLPQKNKKKSKKIILSATDEVSYKKQKLESNKIFFNNKLLQIKDSLSVEINLDEIAQPPSLIEMGMFFSPIIPEDTLYKTINFLNKDDKKKYLNFLTKSFQEMYHVVDSITNLLESLTHAEIREFYTKLDNLDNLSSEEINKLLESSDYRKFHSEKLLNMLAQQKPHLLIEYLNTRPSNEKEILLNIRRAFHKKSNKNIRKIKGRSRSKRKILNQRRIRISSDALATTLVSSLVVGEIVGITALIIWLV
ncbi:MAG: hypothetical protein CMP61_06885 [Flavobacteriales bacterium]|nr:hypothetical protein [Flavobacteriales bacterium]|tara:strand:+ start:12320 stop:13315 length:996 start_codon:yes stop_codon:yes gene_type:complete